MGFVSIEKEDLEKAPPRTKAGLRQALHANAEEQLLMRELKIQFQNEGNKQAADQANKIWLALKTIHTQLEGLHRRAR
jgi:hypothetical protein